MRSKVVVATQRNLHGLMNRPKGTIIHAYKYIHPKGYPEMYPYGSSGSSHKRPIVYKPGYIYTEDDYDSDPTITCGRGLNVATLSWCKRLGDSATYKLILVSILVEDIVCIPENSTGKFRCKRMHVLKYVRWS